MAPKINSVVVLDNGTALSKVGFAGENSPNYIIPTYPTSPIKSKPNFDLLEKDLSNIKQTLIVEKDFTRGKSPIDRGYIKDWNSMELYWHQIFYDLLKINPTLHPVIFSEPPLNPIQISEKIAEIMFETFSIHSICLILQANLALYATGLTTGCVVDIGDGITKVVPISEGYVITPAIRILDLAGQDITIFLQKILREAGYRLNSPSEKRILLNIKEDLCYVAQNFEQEKELFYSSSDMKKSLKIEDGTEIQLLSEQIIAPECLFKPYLIGKEIMSLPETIVEAISQCDLNLRKELFNNIVLSGGTTNFPGLKQRLKKEIIDIITEKMEVNVFAPQLRELSTWIGGSIFGTIRSFNDLIITKQQFLKNGLN